MKTLMLHTITTMAALNILSACTQSDSGPKSNSITNPQTKVETESAGIVGIYEGVSAVCEDGSEAKKDNESIQRTTITFGADGVFKSEVQIRDQFALETKGSYTVTDDRLILTVESQEYEGNVGFTNEKTEAGFKINGKELTLTLIPHEESSCPPDKALIIKYQRQESPQETVPNVDPKNWSL
ncbi:MAG: hypothetical protein JSU04_08690 [Bdellovibrionales bacterium]|nr:hypothetical protein [Bdellovibrionales bacterium]